jgi:hypothetical protein
VASAAQPQQQPELGKVPGHAAGVRLVSYSHYSLRITLTGLALFSASLCGLHAAQPNIIYILADDMGCGDVSAYNVDSKIQTPHIDSLASEGLLFTDAHTNSSVCTYTRSGMIIPSAYADSKAVSTKPATACPSSCAGPM